MNSIRIWVRSLFRYWIDSVERSFRTHTCCVTWFKPWRWNQTSEVIAESKGIMIMTYEVNALTSEFILLLNTLRQTKNLHQSCSNEGKVCLSFIFIRHVKCSQQLCHLSLHLPGLLWLLKESWEVYFQSSCMFYQGWTGMNAISKIPDCSVTLKIARSSHIPVDRSWHASHTSFLSSVWTILSSSNIITTTELKYSKSLRISFLTRIPFHWCTQLKIHSALRLSRFVTEIFNNGINYEQTNRAQRYVSHMLRWIAIYRKQFTF